METNPPLFYTLLKFMLHFGESEPALRTLPAIFGVLGVLLTYLLGWSLGGRTVGLVAAMLLATSAAHIRFSQQVRPYTLLTAAGVLAVWGLVRVLQCALDNIRRDTGRSARPSFAAGKPVAPGEFLGWYAYVLATIVALYSHNTAVLIPAIANLVALGLFVTVLRYQRQFLIKWLAANLIVALVWSWWVPVVLKQTVVNLADFWIVAPDIKGAALTLGAIYGQRLIPAFVDHPWLNLLAPVPLLALIGAWQWRHRVVNLVPMAFVVGVPLLLFIISRWRPVWLDRTVLWPIAITCMFAAAGILSLSRRWLRWAVVAVVLAVNVAGTIGYYANYSTEPWNRVAEYIGDRLHGNDACLFFPQYAESPFAYYFRNHDRDCPRFGLYIAQPGQARADTATEQRPLSDLPAIAAAYDRLWVVFRNRDVDDRDGTVLAAVEALGLIADRFEAPPGLDVILVDTRSGSAAEPLGQPERVERPAR